MSVVSDASALIDLLLVAPTARTIADVLASSDGGIDVPSVCDVEVASVLRRQLLLGALSRDRALTVLHDYADLEIARHHQLALLPRVLDLSDNFSAPDAAYVALAEHLGAPLLTTDERLARATQAFTDVAVLP